ncbi:MAG TPA: hypothetical protein VGJ05_05625 [Fimbriiglobus sp.]|jgi:hypothetical protein
MRRVLFGFAVALGIVAWVAARPGDKTAHASSPDDLSDVHSQSSAEYRYHTSGDTHWRQVALRR